MDVPNARVLDASQAKIARRHLSRVITGAVLGTFLLGSAASGVAKRKGGRKKKVCKCAIGFHCEKGKCVPDA
jgi:hypothetical protein